MYMTIQSKNLLKALMSQCRSSKEILNKENS